MTPESYARHVVVRGRVQGVSYRVWTEDAARSHGLSGWVRNRRDGSVEAVFVGERAAVEAMIAECWRGPPAARVNAVDEKAASQQARALCAGDGFLVLATV